MRSTTGKGIFLKIQNATAQLFIKYCQRTHQFVKYCHFHPVLPKRAPIQHYIELTGILSYAAQPRALPLSIAFDIWFLLHLCFSSVSSVSFISFHFFQIRHFIMLKRAILSSRTLSYTAQPRALALSLLLSFVSLCTFIHLHFL